MIYSYKVNSVSQCVQRATTDYYTKLKNNSSVNIA